MPTMWSVLRGSRRGAKADPKASRPHGSGTVPLRAGAMRDHSGAKPQRSEPIRAALTGVAIAQPGNGPPLMTGHDLRDWLVGDMELAGQWIEHGALVALLPDFSHFTGFELVHPNKLRARLIEAGFDRAVIDLRTRGRGKPVCYRVPEAADPCPGTDYGTNPPEDIVSARWAELEEAA